VHANLNVRVPDLAVTCSRPEPDDKLLRDPLVVIEILSPSNRADTGAAAKGSDASIHRAGIADG
jgi:Uma2 family endonuclease